MTDPAASVAMTPLISDYLLIDVVVLTLLIGCAIAAVRCKDILVSTVLMGLFSFLMATTYLLLDAPDVALTEAAVGAGISTVLFLLTLSFTPRNEKGVPATQSTLALFVVIVMGGMLFYAVDGLPIFGSPDAPIHQHVAPYYLEQMPNDIDIPNIVTAILASYRGFDTMGEVAVIFTAGIGLAALLMNLPQLRTVNTASVTAPSTRTEVVEEKPAPAKKQVTKKAPAKKPAAKKAAPKKAVAKKTTTKKTAAKKKPAKKKGDKA